jgi:hypothetical protein
MTLVYQLKRTAVTWNLSGAYFYQPLHIPIFISTFILCLSYAAYLYNLMADIIFKYVKFS